MTHFYDLASISQTAKRCREEGIPLAEKAIRTFVKTGVLKHVMSGNKALIYWENVLNFIKKGYE